MRNFNEKLEFGIQNCDMRYKSIKIGSNLMKLGLKGTI